METALIGLVGVLLGIVLNEQLRRRNRIENYSTSVFEKRLELYEKLFQLVSSYSAVGTEVIENKTLSKDERHDLVSVAILEVAEFCDANELYIGEELTLHCVSILMGVEEIQDIESEIERKEAIEHFQENLGLAKKMIRKETGISDLDKLFRSIIKPKHSSSIIKYYKKRKKELGVKGKWN